MPLTVHHLQYSQSDRITWLCEELNIPYNLVIHQRNPLYSPQAIKDLTPLGQAPVIQDDGAKGPITLAESGACVEYIIQRHGGGRLALPPTHADYADYLYWLNFANGTFQPQLLMLMYLGRVDVEGANPATQHAHNRFTNMLAVLDARLKVTNAWLAGAEFTAADIMLVTSLTSLRAFFPYDLSPYPAILAYLQRIVAREAYIKAKAKADPDMELAVNGKPPKSFMDIQKDAGKM